MMEMRRAQSEPDVGVALAVLERESIFRTDKPKAKANF